MSLMRGTKLVIPHGGNRNCCSHFQRQLVVPVHSKRDQIVNFKKHTLNSRGPGCLGSPSARLFSGNGALCKLSLTETTVTGRSQTVIIRNCFSIVTLRTTKVRGTITTLNATVGTTRIHRVLHCARSGRVLLGFSTSTTKIGTTRQTVNRMRRVTCHNSIRLQILGVPSNGSPSRFLHRRDPTSCQSLIGSTPL